MPSAFPIPDAVLANHAAFLGKTGSGKTSTEKLVVEHVVDAGYRVCVLDTIKSDWWGITSSADGKSPGLPFRILGGPRGHVPLPSSAGAVVGRLVAEGALPLSIVDMADFEPGGVQHFFVDFAQALMRHMRGVLYLVIEEAHEVAPKERAGFGAENMAIHMAKKLATAGRSKGIRLIVATQRVQSLHNAVLGSCETVVAHRLTTPADQKPVIDWLKANSDKATADRVASSLSGLRTGTGWLCSGEAQIFDQVAFPKFRTFDNTATPTTDSDVADVTMAPVDHDELAGLIGDAVAEAEANDPKALKARIAELEKAGGGSSEADQRRIDALEGQRDDLRGEIEKLTTERDHFKAGFEEYRRRIFAALDALGAKTLEKLDEEEFNAGLKPAIASAAPSGGAPATGPGREESRKPVPPPAPHAQAARLPRPDGETAPVPSGCAKPLAVLAGAYPGGMTEAQWSTAAGYKKTGGTWKEYRSRLNRAAMIEKRGDMFYATALGASSAGEVELPPAPGSALARWWAARISGTPKMVEVLIEAWPNRLSREELAARLEMTATGGTFKEYLSRLKRNGLLDDNGGIRLSAEVMGHG